MPPAGAIGLFATALETSGLGAAGVVDAGPCGADADIEPLLKRFVCVRFERKA